MTRFIYSKDQASKTEHIDILGLVIGPVVAEIGGADHRALIVHHDPTVI